MVTQAAARAKKRPYMREHSTHIRGMSRVSHESVEEDPIIARESTSRAMIVVACRARQRKLQHAWSRWTQHTGVIHDYLGDVIRILSRPIPATELRTELEIEVFFKWVLQDFALDPTGIAYTLFMCKSKRRIVNLIQGARLDRYEPGEAVLLQNTAPHPDDGLFTVLRGSVDIVILPRESDQVMRLQRAKKHNDTDEIHQILTEEGVLVDTLQVGAGFGELSALTKVRRAASIVATEGPADAEILVVTTKDLIDCLDKRRKVSSKAPQVASAEVMDFLRQTGLVHKATIMDVMQAAANITKKTYPVGTLLYKQGDKVDKAFIVLSGEIFLDRGNFEDSRDAEGHPFQNVNPANCFVLASGSILGDEGMIGVDRTYEASAVVLSENSVVFEIEGFAISFLGGRLGVEKYSALLYKDKSTDAEACDEVLDQVVLHSTFNCLRKVISEQNPFRKVSRPVYSDRPVKANFVIKKKEEVKAKRVSNTFVPTDSPATPPPGNSHSVVKSESNEDSASLRLSDAQAAKNSRQARAKGGVSVNLHPTGASAEGHKVLSNGAMHHLHFVRRGLKQRELMAMRGIAERTVLHQAKMKKDTKHPVSSSVAKTAHHQSTHEYSNNSQYKDNAKYRRAMDAYLKRKDFEFGEQLLQLEKDELSVIQSLQMSLESDKEDLFQSAANQVLEDIDSASRSERSEGSPGHLKSSNQEMQHLGNIGMRSKLEQYYLALERAQAATADALKNSLAQRRQSRMPNALRRPTAVPTFLNMNPRAIGSGRAPSMCVVPGAGRGSPPGSPSAVIGSLQKDAVADSFCRVVTTRTVGVERVSSEETSPKPSKFIRSTVITRDRSALLALFDKDAAKKERRKTEDQKSYEIKLRKFLDIAENHSRSREELCRGDYGNPQSSVNSPARTSASGRSFLEVHNKQQSLKSNSNNRIGSKLLRKASMRLVGESSKNHSMSDIVVDSETGSLKLKEKMGINPWQLSYNDLTEIKHKASERARVLQTWQEMMEQEPDRSSHQDGRRKSVATSEHRCNTERDRIKSEEEIQNLSMPGVTQDMKDLLRWKQYCAQQVLEMKYGPLHSMPTLAKQGSNAYLGRKMIVNTVERPQTAPSGPNQSHAHL